jgi:hypothetical protein
MGNKAVTLATNLLFDCYISDMETGYKVLRTDLWRRLSLEGLRFDIEPDITARVLRLGYRIHEVPIHYYARSRAEGKKLTWVDGVRAIGTLVRLRFRSDSGLFGVAPDWSYHAKDRTSSHASTPWSLVRSRSRRSRRYGVWMSMTSRVGLLMITAR